MEILKEHVERARASVERTKTSVEAAANWFSNVRTKRKIVRLFNEVQRSAQPPISGWIGDVKLFRADQIWCGTANVIEIQRDSDRTQIAVFMYQEDPVHDLKWVVSGMRWPAVEQPDTSESVTYQGQPSAFFDSRNYAGSTMPIADVLADVLYAQQTVQEHQHVAV